MKTLLLLWKKIAHLLRDLVVIRIIFRKLRSVSSVNTTRITKVMWTMENLTDHYAISKNRAKIYLYSQLPTSFSYTELEAMCIIMFSYTSLSSLLQWMYTWSLFIYLTFGGDRKHYNVSADLGSNTCHSIWTTNTNTWQIGKYKYNFNTKSTEHVFDNSSHFQH